MSGAIPPGCTQAATATMRSAARRVRSPLSPAARSPVGGRGLPVCPGLCTGLGLPPPLQEPSDSRELRLWARFCAELGCRGRAAVGRSRGAQPAPAAAAGRPANTPLPSAPRHELQGAGRAPGERPQHHRVLEMTAGMAAGARTGVRVSPGASPCVSPERAALRSLLRAARGRQRLRRAAAGPRALLRAVPRCHSDAMAAGPAPLLPAEAEALVRSLQGTELRDTGGQGCGGTALLETRPAGGGPRLCVAPEGLGVGGRGGMKKGL